MNDLDDGTANNFRSPHYAIARTTGLCAHCRGETGLVALMLPPQHEVLAIDEEDEEGCGNASIRGNTWECAPRHAFLFYVESLPDEIRRRLQALAPTYRFALSPATHHFYWANHCARCDRIQEDHDLFCEPDGAFVPVSPPAATRIELLPIPEALEAAATGYAIDPQFIDFDVRA